MAKKLKSVTYTKKPAGTAGVINDYKGKKGAGKPTAGPSPAMKKGGSVKSKKKK